jgi:hypothetical protein
MDEYCSHEHLLMHAWAHASTYLSKMERCMRTYLCALGTSALQFHMNNNIFIIRACAEYYNNIMKMYVRPDTDTVHMPGTRCVAFLKDKGK